MRTRVMVTAALIAAGALVTAVPASASASSYQQIVVHDNDEDRGLARCADEVRLYWPAVCRVEPFHGVVSAERWTVRLPAR